MEKRSIESNSKEELIIIGTSKTAIHVYEFVKYYDLFRVVAFAVDEEYMTGDSFLGLPLYPISELSQIIDPNKVFVFVAMLWNHLNADRRSVYNRVKGMGFKCANLISPTAIIRGNIIGDNCWFHDYTVVQNDAIVESNIMAMAFSLIGAHAHVHSHCFLGAKCTVAGGCTVGEQTFVGINSTVFDDTQIGNKCIIGACTTVKRNMPDNSKWVTASDNFVIKQYDEGVIEDKLISKLNVR